MINFILRSCDGCFCQRKLWGSLLVWIFLFSPVIAIAQIHGTPGTSVFDSVMEFRIIKSLPTDTTKHFHIEPDEEEEMDHNLKPDPSVPVFREVPSTNTSTGNSGSLVALSPAPTVNFTGTTDVQTSIPPDVQGAAGPTYLMEMENERVEILGKTGTAHSTVTESAFWTSMSPNSPYDPRIRYDPYSQRWIALIDDYGESSSSCFYIAVSATSDPTGTWQFHKIRADSTSTLWVDYPTLGFNKNWIVVTGNMFTVSGNTYTASYLWAFNKTSLYSNSVSYTRINMGQTNTMQPAATYDSTQANEYMMQVVNPASGLIGLYSISGSVGSESYSTLGYLQGSVDWSFNPASTNTGLQKNSTNDIDLDDSRMQSVVYRNGYIWGVHTVFLPTSSPTRASVQWWQLTTSGINQRGIIDDSVGGISYAYPSICVNSYNDALIGYSSFGSNQYASADYSFRYSCDTLSKLESDYVYQAGANTYYQTAGGTANRWGDYSATVVDPTNDENFWTVQEYASSTSNIWNTWWAEVSPTHNANGGSGTWTWTGGRSTSWFEACNWDKGSLPDASSDVVIPGGTTYEPTITGATGYCKTISINTSNGGVLTVATASSGLLSVAQ